MGISIDAQNRCNNDQYYEALDMVFGLMWKRIRYPWYWFSVIRWLSGYDQKLDHYCNICKRFTRQVCCLILMFRIYHQKMILVADALENGVPQ